MVKHDMQKFTLFIHRKKYGLLLFLIFLTVCLGLTISYFIAAANTGEKAAERFSEKAGGELILSAADDPEGWLYLLDPAFSPVPAIKPLAAADKILAFLSALRAVEQYYFITLTSSCLYMETDCKSAIPAVRLYGINAAAIPLLFPESRVLPAGLPEPGVLISGKLAAGGAAGCSAPVKPGDKLILVRDCTTYLDALETRVVGIVQAGGKAVFMDYSAFNLLFPVPDPITDNAADIAPAAAGQPVITGDFPVKDAVLPDSFFFDVPAAPDNVGVLPQVSAGRYHFLVVQTGETETVAAAVRNFITANQLPFAVRYWKDYKKPGAENSILLPVLILVLLCTGSIVFLLYLTRGKKTAQEKGRDNHET